MSSAAVSLSAEVKNPRPRGAVILGGSHGTLALTRSLGAIGVPVWLVTNDSQLPRYSRYLTEHITWAGPNEPGAVSALVDIAHARDLTGFMLVPAGDGEARLTAMAHAQLSAMFEVMVPPWDQLRWACDKGLAHQRAAGLKLSIPRLYEVATPPESMQFPVVLKPAMRLRRNRFTVDRAWRADDLPSFRRLHADAVALQGVDGVVVQDLVPRGGENLSYGGLWADGREVAGFAARRSRRYPREFSHTNTFVETVDDGEVMAAARKFLTSIGYRGLVEIQFARDRRDGVLKLLDVNPRPWSWMGLATAAGVDLGAMLWALANDQRPAPARARPGVAWMHLRHDLVASWHAIAAGELSIGAYLGSLGAVRSWAAFAPTDPLPVVADGSAMLNQALGRIRTARSATA